MSESGLHDVDARVRIMVDEHLLAALLSAAYRLSRPVEGLPGIRHSRERVPRFSVERCRRAVVDAGADVDRLCTEDGWPVTVHTP